MPDQDSTSQAGGGYTGVLGRIVDGLKSQPALLFGLGGGIVLLGLSPVIGAEAWMLVLGVVLILLAALGAWFFGARAQTRAAANEIVGAGVEISDEAVGIERPAGAEGGAAIRSPGGKVVVTGRSRGILERDGPAPPPSAEG
jgi:hypothetical protein